MLSLIHTDAFIFYDVGPSNYTCGSLIMKNQELVGTTVSSYMVNKQIFLVYIQANHSVLIWKYANVKDLNHKYRGANVVVLLRWRSSIN